MKKITLLIVFLLITFVSFSQVLNQPANWPNANWTTSGTYTAVGLLGDPSVDNSFSFDDDDAGGASDDDIASESPLIDLTAAFNATENLIAISGDYTHRDIGGTLLIEWWDADAGSWNSLVDLNGTSTVNDYQTCSNLVPFETGFDITGFTTTQLTGFKYRYAYDDADGWQWGWCIQNSIISSQGASLPNCDAVVTAPADGASGESVDPTINWNAATGFPDGYFVSIGTTNGGTDVVNNQDVGNAQTYAAATLAYSTTYYITITPYNGTGTAIGCVSSSFTTETDPNTTVICTNGPVNTVFCYENNNTIIYSFVSDDGSSLSLTINQGQVETGWDELIIYDSDGVTNLNGADPYGVGGDISGLTFQSSGDTISLYVQSDSSINCQANGYIPIDFNVSCASCTNPTANFALVNDCANGEQFLMEVDLTSLGTATSIDVTDNQGSAAQTVTATGIVTMGPYPNGSNVSITLTNNNDGNCVIASASFTQAVCPPGNDLCANAFPIACGESDSGNTSGATETDEPSDICDTGGGSGGVWYSFLGTGDLITFSLCNSTFDTKIQVWEGDCTGLTCVVGQDDSAGCGLQSEVEFISTAGTQYYVYVFGFGSSVGDYTLDVTCVEPPTPPANDDCANPTVLIANEDGTCTDFGSATIFGATPSDEDNACGGTADDDVWFTFEAMSENHGITLFNIVGDTQDLYHVLYEGSDCNNLIQVYCSDPNDSVANGLTIGNTYTIRVYSWTGTPLQDVNFDICVLTIPPPITTNDTEYTVEELIQDVLIDSECNQVFNITWSTGTDFGSTNGIGYFDGNGSEWPFESGLVMTTGDVLRAPGPEDETLNDGSFAWPGDADLENFIPGLFPGDTNNASFIEFDFVPVIDHMSFDFIFAAEEYGTFQCTFTDAFAFLLTDSNGVTTNLAIVPGTVDPISVLTVRDEAFNGGCPSVNPEFFANYYGAPNGQSTLLSPTDFRGHTVVMTAEADVIPNELYHIKLVVADDGDTLFDSAVFLAAGSFDIGDFDLGDDILLASGNANCEGDEVTLDAGILPNNSTISWFRDGQLIEGESGTTINVGTTAFYRADIVFNNTDSECAFTDEILVEFFPNPQVSFADESIIKCANEAYTLEALAANADDPNMGPLTYIWTLDGIELQSSSSSTYTLTAEAEQQGDIIVTVFDDVTGCWGQSQILINFYENAYCVDIPQGLSPNGDGFNDCLILDHLEDREDIAKAEVFNRYGTKVFELNDYVDQWCGTDQDGKVLPVGTYFYIIYFNSSRETITSWIYLNY